MDITRITQGYDKGLDLDLHHLRAFDSLMRERSLTRAARALNVTQPALSKTLARLRRHFADPLFVRVSLRMEPTPKAVELAEPVRGILDRMRNLETTHVPFDPRTSSRTFKFCVVDAGVAKLLPPLVTMMMREAPHVRLQVLQVDAQQLEGWLESGKIDFAMGSYPGLIKGVRRQQLWVERYVGVVRKGHPRLGARPSLRAFVAEKHVLVSTQGTGHAHRRAERAIEAAIPPANIICRVPMFIAAAVMAKHTDTVAILPLSIAMMLARDLDLEMIAPPIKLPKIEIAQYWHERFDREPGIQWIRKVFPTLFRRPIAV